MPRTSLRAHAVDALPDARKAVTFLEEAGQPALATAVSRIVEFTEDRTGAEIRNARRDADLDPPVSLFVTEAFKNHIKAAQDPKKPLAQVVTPYLDKFLAGRWTPPAPPGVPVVKGVVPTLKRAPRGPRPPSRP
ncbi:hypothetical protein [Streptomyces sp. Wb2n-11]|uniref:hypothetical protein n=1 Tax=Streptomyces sp. Wb2n-11 TaxID=1030533 RepID=UPI000A3F1C30|nr:hypothetical protein [Streptomyces sp. Wb2n-11]